MLCRSHDGVKDPDSFFENVPPGFSKLYDDWCVSIDTKGNIKKESDTKKKEEEESGEEDVSVAGQPS